MVSLVDGEGTPFAGTGFAEDLANYIDDTGKVEMAGMPSTYSASSNVVIPEGHFTHDGGFTNGDDNTN